MGTIVLAGVLFWIPVSRKVGPIHGSLTKSVDLPTRVHSVAMTLSAMTGSGPSYPVGVPDVLEPSGVAPPSPAALPGYQLSYVNDFAGVSLPPGWQPYDGTPSSDPGGQWSRSHVVVGGGLLELNTYRDPSFHDEWVTGGVCHCGLPRTYGAYFVRSRLTGPGPTSVELLWPVGSWPPEVDFSETYGAVNSSMATTHFTSANREIHQIVSVNMTQWHTWGVIWGPGWLDYTLDGHVWGVVSSSLATPSVPMTFDIQQQTFCAAGWACPRSPQSLLVDWVAEYQSVSVAPPEVGPFAVGSATLTTSERRTIDRIALLVQDHGVRSVVLRAYPDPGQGGSTASRLALERARVVATYLEHGLAALHDGSVSVHLTRGLAAQRSGRVVALLRS